MYDAAIACPRVLISILELYQQPDGSIVVPEVLRQSQSLNIDGARLRR